VAGNHAFFTSPSLMMGREPQFRRFTGFLSLIVSLALKHLSLARLAVCLYSETEFFLLNK
jgi:hypothetical protein